MPLPLVVLLVPMLALQMVPLDLPLIIFYAHAYVFSYSSLILDPKAPPSLALFFLRKALLGNSTTTFLLFSNVVYISSLTNRKPPFFNQKFSTTWHLQLCFNYIFLILKIELWQLPIKLICLLYWYIIESIFQLCRHLPNIPSINNVSKLNFQLCNW